ncbi:MAG: type II toxin-antitoxin system VapC family toxin [Candidatus Limnocylindria bacterium]
MSLLLDAHVVLWWLFGLPIRDEAQSAIGDPLNRLVVSVSAIWEIEIKRRVGRLSAPDDLLGALDAASFEILPIYAEHAVTAGRLPLHHGDPFDRMLVAQAQRERLTLVTRDERLASYDIPILVA